MDGRPVWLASVSRREPLTGAIVPTEVWLSKMALRNKGVKILHEVLRGIGDRSRERLFRMNITLCLHRGLTEEEEAGLPEWWHATCPVDLAGGPVEILKAKGCSERPSVFPCENPGKEFLRGGASEGDARLWVPIDCGECAPCLDRKHVRRSPGDLVLA